MKEFKTEIAQELQKEFTRIRELDHVQLRLAVEFGFRCCEMGMNLEAAFLKFEQVMKGEI